MKKFCLLLCHMLFHEILIYRPTTIVWFGQLVSHNVTCIAYIKKINKRKKLTLTFWKYFTPFITFMITFD
mgnify:CR=1 FL=1